MINSFSDSVHASLIIQHQLKQQLHDKERVGLNQEREEPGKLKPHPEKILEEEEAEQEKGVGLCDQLMLVSALFGIEMSMSFDQMYEILMLQFLGVPLALVSVNGILAGCISMIFLPLIGAWSDGGKNPKARKLFTMYAALGIFGGGLILLIVASFLKIQQIENTFGDLNNQTVRLDSLSGVNGYNFTPTPATTNSLDETPLEYASLPGLIFLAIVGFAGLDVGFDVTVSLSRALILENVPSFQHMRVLVLATVVQSSAGTMSSTIGCFDLPGFLGTTFKTDGAAATLIFFCCIILFVTITGFFLMSVASYRLRKKDVQIFSPSESLPFLQSFSTSQVSGVSTSLNANAVHSEDAGQVTPYANPRRDVKRKLILGSQEQLVEERPYVPDILHTEEGDTSTRPLLLEDSLRVNYYSTINAAAPTANYQDDQERNPTRMQRGNPVGGSTSTLANSTYASGDTENPNPDMPKFRHRTVSQSKAIDPAGVSTVLSVIRQSYSMSMSQRGALGDFHDRKLNQLREAQSKISAKEKEALRRKTKLRLVVLCMSTFFTIGASISCSVYSANTLNLGIMHGDPTALAGTEGRDNYEKGLQYGAIGNLILYISFMSVSLSNNKIIESIGEKGQYALFHVLLIVSLLTIIGTQMVEVYFVYMVFAGAFRTCMLTLPFVLAHKFTQEGMSKDPTDPEQKVSHTGRVMTLIGFLIPTHYLILSIVLGPLMEATGNPWVPLYYCLASTSASLTVFSVLFFI